jgi:NADPH2:quinone reductase
MGNIESEAIFLCKTGNPEVAFQRRVTRVNSPEKNNVLVEVEAFGLNYADVMARRGLYQEAPPLPCIIGYEVVGRIIQCGPEADQHLVGQRVVAFCRFGGYSKHVITNDSAVVKVDDQPASELLALGTQAVTAYYMAEYITPIHERDTVLVHAAAGGVGTILIQLAKLKGAEVIAKVGRDEKRSVVNKLGADFTVNYNTSDYIEQIKHYLKGARIDISFNPVAGGTFKKDMNILGSGGRMVLFGGSELSRGKWGLFSKINFVRKMGVILPIKLMINSKSIIGVNMLKIADNKPKVLENCLKEVVALYQRGKITPQIGGEYNIDELNEAHEALESGNSTGKLAVFW